MASSQFIGEAAHAVVGGRRQCGARPSCWQRACKASGYETDILSSIEEASTVFRTTFYAALILDLGLPDGDGLALLREIRHRNNPIPVLVLTARGGLHDRVQGLRSGADDYLVKPFALEELVARLEAQLRRPGHLLGSSLRIANLEFDTSNRQASIDDKPQMLSARETAVLELLMRSKGRVVSKKQVEDHIFGHSGGCRIQRHRGVRSPSAQAAFGKRRQGEGPDHTRSGIPDRRGEVA